MKKTAFIVLLTFSTALPADAQFLSSEKDRAVRSSSLAKPGSTKDRAAGTHNGSNIGLFFENRGKLYPRRVADGPSGEFPINSGQNYIYRINPMVGIPGNVIQGRYTTNEEWEAVGGFQNSAASRIAFSDNPQTWNETRGWPVKDSLGNPLIKSDQDSYCVYNDANNSRSVLGITMIQTGYAYGVKYAANMIFYKFQIVNDGPRDYDNVYFGMYCDIDVGDVSGGDPEWGDDKIGYDKAKNFLYFFDDGLTTEWKDGKTGYFGCAMLRTPKVNGAELGATDMHYNVYNDDMDRDTIQYGIMASSPSLYNSSLSSKYFHLGSSTNLHYDDPATVRPQGDDMLATISSGPYRLVRGDTLTFITAILAGTDYNDVMLSYDQAVKILSLNFEASKPPATPRLTGLPGDRRVTLFWDDKAEYSKDGFTGEYDFEGYRLYRSVDKGVTWSKISDYDLVNNVGLDKGIRYSYTDTTVLNGIEYWYTLTAFDRGDESAPSLESPQGKVAGQINLAIVVPASQAIGRTPPGSSTVTHLGTGKSNYLLDVHPGDVSSLANKTFDVGFTYSQRVTQGTLRTKARADIRDSSRLVPMSYVITFSSPSSVTINAFGSDTNLLTDKYYNPLKANKYSKLQFNGSTSILDLWLEEPVPNAPANQLPKTGDVITLNFSLYATRDSVDTVIVPRPYKYTVPQATYDGVVFTLNAPEVIQNVSRIGGLDNISMTFTIARQESVQNNMYILTTTGSGIDPSGKPFISVSVTDTSTKVIFKADTVVSPGSITFRGLTARIEFPAAKVPAPGNSFAVETVIPVEPSVNDRFRFTVQGATVDQKKAAAQIQSIKVVPNPYIVSSLYEPEFGELRREPLRQLQFTNLPMVCTIYIFTLDANLVKTIYHNSTGGSEFWDLRAEAGREVAAGIYLFVVKSDAGEHRGRFAIIK
jgi:hypothetical protein